MVKCKILQKTVNFLEKYELLKKSIPVPAVMSRESSESEYVDWFDIGKNCYYCFESYRLFDSMYTNSGWGNRLIDCSSSSESEKCYSCVDCFKCHSSTYLRDCSSSNDCHFSAFLNSCTDCFGSVTLTHKKYCIFNKQYTKEEYFEKVAELKKEKPEKLLKQMYDLLKQVPHPASRQVDAQNCPYGNHINESKDCFWVFQIVRAENSGYGFWAGWMRNCWDTYFFGGDSRSKSYAERCYEHVYTDGCYDSAFLSFSFNCTNCNYGAYLRGCTDCFGCVGLKNKKYCILNNQLTKEQYEKAVIGFKKELGWAI